MELVFLPKFNQEFLIHFLLQKKLVKEQVSDLDLVNRIIKRHKGEIKVHSKPGRTEFHICLPIIPIKTISNEITIYNNC